jgi:hypothetical protein
MMEIYTFSISNDACSGGHMDIFLHFTMCFVHLRGAHDGNIYILLSNDACSGGHMDIFIHFTMCFVHLRGAHDGNIYILHQ